MLREGAASDYRQLAAFHYLRHEPVTATRVFVLIDQAPTVAERFGYAGERQRIVAVLVESLPALSCTLRDEATGGRYRGWRDRRAVARLLNAEVRCISRVVVHPQWRGLGLAVRLVRHALATMTTPYTEALAAMGRVHPFFKLAGMTECRRWPHAKDQRLLDAMRAAGVEPWELANTGAMERSMDPSPGYTAAREGAGVDRVSSTGPQDGNHNPQDGNPVCGFVPSGRIAHPGLLRRELARWAGRGLTLTQQLERARDHLLCEPVYYLKEKQESKKAGKQENRKSEGGDRERSDG